MKFSFLRRSVIATTISLMATVGHAAVAERPLTSVSLDVTLADAHKLAARNPALQVMQVQGKSMLPFFGDGSVLVVKQIDASKLRTGMVVVYHNRFGETVAHRLINPVQGGWVAQGYNNATADTTVVNATNLIGVVYGTFHSNGQVEDRTMAMKLLTRTQVALAAPAK